MEPERWQQIDRIVAAALELQEAERSAYLDEACGGDEVLRRKVETLLVAHQEAEDFLEELAVEMAAEGFAKDRASKRSSMYWAWSSSASQSLSIPAHRWERWSSLSSAPWRSWSAHSFANVWQWDCKEPRHRGRD